jgi:hypothetical protein
MKRLDFSRCALIISGVAALLSACGGSQPPIGVPGASTQGATVPSMFVGFGEASPPVCKGQKKTKHYASVTGKLAKKSGSLCIPAFGGYGGKLNYPGVIMPVKMKLTSSTTNYADIPPPTGSGTPIFYLNLAPSGSTTFGTKVRAGGGLTGKKIKPKTAYTAYLEGYAYGFWRSLASCYSVAKTGGVIGSLGTLLKGQQAFGATGHSAFEIFIYVGQAGNKC